MTPHDRDKAKLLEYLGNPDNEILNRMDLSTKVLGHKTASHIYYTFTPTELTEIEDEALSIRRKNYSPKIAKVDIAMLKKAAEGDSTAAKLVYQRFENWSEKLAVKSEVDGNIRIRWMEEGEEKDTDG